MSGPSTLCRKKKPAPSWASSDAPAIQRELRLTDLERDLLEVLRASLSPAPSSALYNALYPDGGPSIKIIDVKVCHVRRRLAQAGYGAAIDTYRKTGKLLTPETRAALDARFGPPALTLALAVGAGVSPSHAADAHARSL